MVLDPSPPPLMVHRNVCNTCELQTFLMHQSWQSYVCQRHFRCVSAIDVYDVSGMSAIHVNCRLSWCMSHGIHMYCSDILDDQWMCMVYQNVCNWCELQTFLMHQQMWIADIPDASADVNCRHSWCIIHGIHIYCRHFWCISAIDVSAVTVTSHGGHRTWNIWISRSTRFPGRSFEWRGLCLFTGKLVWKWGDLRENVFSSHFCVTNIMHARLVRRVVCDAQCYECLL